MFPSVSELLISHFTPVANRSEAFTSSELLSSLVPLQNHLTSLCINDVHLDESPTPILHDDFAYFGLGTIDLENIHNTCSVRQILDILRGSSDLHITRCPLSPGYIYDGNLTLKEIDSGEDLVGFLTECFSDKLVIDNCPGFDDDILNAMMSSESEADWLTMPACTQYVEALVILERCRQHRIFGLYNFLVTCWMFRQRIVNGSKIVCLNFRTIQSNDVVLLS
jgi:hypothetical protein